MPVEYEGVKAVSFGYAGQGSAIMRGPMVSGWWAWSRALAGSGVGVSGRGSARAARFGRVDSAAAVLRQGPPRHPPPPPPNAGLVQQLLTTSEWGQLDYLIVDFPPGTGDIQLTLCQSVAFSAAVIVTTPQKLAFIDVAKGIRMFAKLMVRVVVWGFLAVVFVGSHDVCQAQLMVCVASLRLGSIQLARFIMLRCSRGSMAQALLILPH